MKLYRATGTYYEKQADVPRGTKFETVEFPFAASPKADFVGWLNANTFIEGRAEEGDRDPWKGHENDPMFPLPAAKPIGPCRSTAISPLKAEVDFRREVEERWEKQPLTWRLDLGMTAFEEARGRLV